MPTDRPRRLIIDNDGNDFCVNMTTDLDGDIEEVISFCPEEVTTYMVCPGAGTYYYPTKIGVTDPRKKRLNEHLGNGVDPLGRLLEALKKAGKETFLTFRMNDVHNPTDVDQWNTPVIRREHPEMIVDPEGAKEPEADWMCWCLDYTQPEVQNYILSLLEELADLYTVDGFQLDWLRFPRHLPGNPEEVWSHRESLTKIVEEAHRIFSAKGTKLSVRVPTSLAGCRYLGLDVAEWAANGWIDMVVMCPFLTTDYVMPIDELRQELHPANLPIYGGFDYAHGWQIQSPESLRAASTSLYDCGADGIYIFNFPCWSQQSISIPTHYLPPLANPETACQKPLLFSLPIIHHIRKEITDEAGVLPVSISPNQKCDLRIQLPPKALPAGRAMLHIVGPGDFELSVNGKPTTELQSRRRRQLIPSAIGNDGWMSEFSYTAEDCRAYRFDPSALQPGSNTLTFTNTGNEPSDICQLNLGLW
jgi:hypothetical protein